MLGAIIGDIVGSVYEFNNYKAKDFEPFFSPSAFFTDDTICTVAVADALVNNIDPAAALRNWGRRYWDNGGWGMRFAEWIADEILRYVELVQAFKGVLTLLWHNSQCSARARNAYQSALNEIASKGLASIVLPNDAYSRLQAFQERIHLDPK